MREEQVGRSSNARSLTFDAAARLADRVDRLSVPLAENVVRRVTGSFHEGQFASGSSVGFDEVVSVSEGHGVDSAAVRQALLAELDTEQVMKTSWLDRIFAPQCISGGIVVAARDEAVAAQIEAWMRQVEGMYPTVRSEGIVRWEPVRARGRLAAIMGNAELTAVETRQTSLGDGGQLVEIDVDATSSQRGGLTFMATGVVVGAIAGACTAWFENFAPAIVEFLIPFGLASLIGLGGGMALSKLMMQTIKQQINRVLKGVVDIKPFRRGARPELDVPSGEVSWHDIVREISH